MRGLGVSFLLRRARVSWLLLACVAVTVLLATGLAAVLWTFAGAVVPFGAQGFLADPQDRVLAINGPVNAREAAADSQQIRAALRQAWPGVGFQLESALWTDQLQLPSPGNPNGHQADPARVAGRDQRPGDADRRHMARSAAPRRSGACRVACRRGQPAAPDGRLGADGHSPVRRGGDLAAGHRPVPGQ